MATTAHKAELKALTAAACFFMPKGSIIAGGALTSVFTGQPINDVDLYFKSEAAFREAVERAYDDGLWCVASTGRAVTFVQGNAVIQLMHFDWFEDAAAVFDCFDFTACMGAYDCDTKEFVFHDDFLKHASQRFLRFHAGTRFPFGTLLRVLKYQARGYTIGKGDLLRIALRCHETPLTSWSDLAEQVGGQYGERVALDGQGEFSVAAAVDLIATTEITAPAQREEQPGTPEALLAKVLGPRPAEPLAA